MGLILFMDFLEKYRPGSIQGIAGQNKPIEEALSWLSQWKPGSGALFFHGPPGCGKTLLAELLAQERGWNLLRMNASDKRTAEEVENSLGEASRTSSLFGSGRLILIDEVDGITGGDRGAVPSIIQVIKSSRFPMIIIANNPWIPKLMPLRSYTKMVKFNKVMSPSIEKKLREVCSSEGIGYKDSVLKNLARFSQGDMRSALSDLQVVTHGKKVLSDKDLDVLGFRERESNIFSVLPTILRSGNIKTSRKVIHDLDKDPDEVFLWIENNLHLVVKDPGKLARSFDLLSKADILRSRVSIQQNWRFKGLMVDLMASVSVFKDDVSPGFVPYQPPKRIAMLGKTKKQRAEMAALCEKLGDFVHASDRIVRREYLPYFRIISKNKGFSDSAGLEISEDEAKLIKG
jgi:replication factor C large subunit